MGGIIVSFDAKDSFSGVTSSGAGGMKTTWKIINKCRKHCLSPQAGGLKRRGHAGALAELVADVSKAKFLFNWVHNTHLAEGLTKTVERHAEH